MKPIFIYKYQPDIARKKDEFLDLFMNSGKQLEKLFISDN